MKTITENIACKRHEYDSVTKIEHFLISRIALTCGLPADAIDKNQPVLALGIESMVAITLNTQLKHELNTELPFDDIANNASLVDIAHSIYNVLHADNREKEPLVVAHDKTMHQLEQLNPSYYDIKQLPQYKKVKLRKLLFKKAGVELPFYRAFDSASTDTIQYKNHHLINFGSYNYLGYNGHSEVNLAAQHATEQWGTSAASSRIVSGEKSIHLALESAIAALYGVEDALVFVSGYGTNVSVISHLMEKNDLIIHDSLAHNSIMTGSKLSQAKRLKFPHNDMAALQRILEDNRLNYNRVLIVVEGLYSMDGDTPPLQALIALKKRYKCLLMVDEAHSVGVLGEHGLGIREHCNVDVHDVDLWMGTLSKTFAGCGGYIAGCWELIDYLKYTAPGFIFSVGLPPPLAGASLKAISLLQQDTYRVRKLQENSAYFLSLARKNQLNTGRAEGHAIIPIIIGNSIQTAQITNFLFYHGINIQSVIYPGVNESEARLRFFISTLHTTAQIDKTFDLLKESNIRNEHEHNDSTSEA